MPEHTGLALCPAPRTPARRHIGQVVIVQLAASQAGAAASGAAPVHEEYFLLAIQRQGLATLRQDARTARLAPGDMALCSSARPCHGSDGSGSRQTVLMLPAARLRDACPDIDALTATAFSGAHALVALLALTADSHFDIPYERLPAQAAELAAAAIIATLAGCLLSIVAAAAPVRAGIAQFHLKRLRQHALAHLADAELSVAKVALALGMSPAHVHRLFAAQAQTFSAWLWETRLQACHLALRQPANAGLSIGQLASRYGFAHPAHFSRVYRARFGMTAREWRAASPSPLERRSA